MNMIKLLSILGLYVVSLAACNQMGGQSEPDVNDLGFPDNFVMENASGEKVSFASLKGKTVFVNLWATWCPPCVAEMPSIQALYNQTAGDDVAFVMLSLDDKFDKAKNWMANRSHTMPVYFAAGDLPPVFQVRSIPTTYVFNPAGKIIYKNIGQEDYSKPKFVKMLQKGSEPEPAP